MSVITELTVVPSRVEAVYRYLLQRSDGEDRTDLTAIMSPPALRRGDDEDSQAGSATVDVLIRGCVKLGVINEGDDGRLRVADSVRTTLPQAPARLRAHLESVLLHPGAAANADQQDFPRVLAWFLTQNPARPVEFGNVKALAEEQLGTDIVTSSLTNQSRFQNFVYWARYLGFAWRYKVDREWVVPDPIEALGRHLPTLLSTDTAVPMSEVVERWRTALPVLEDGEARSEVERSLRAGGREAGVLSRSTSLALARLRDRGVIRFDQGSDAASVFLLDTWPERSRVTHMTLFRGARA